MGNQKENELPLKTLHYPNCHKKKKLDIKWWNNRVVGLNANVFKYKCIVLVHDVENAPLNVNEWVEIPYEKKRKLFDRVTVVIVTLHNPF